MATYSIKEIEHLSGIKAHTIRIWEKRYKIFEPKRTETNIRFYDDEDLKKILNVSVLNRYGFKISKIAELPEERLERELMQVTHFNSNLDGQIESLIKAMIDFDEENFEQVFNRSVVNIGFEETIIRLIYPFFEKIGILWTTGNINPAQEHFVSNLIRQKLIAAINDIPKRIKDQSISFVLFLPEGEWHELGLLFFSYVLKKTGYRITYLGSSLPFDCLEELEKHNTFTHLVTTIKAALSPHDILNYINRIANRFKDKTIIMSGTSFSADFHDIPSNVMFPENLDAFRKYLEKLG